MYSSHAFFKIWSATGSAITRELGIVQESPRLWRPVVSFRENSGDGQHAMRVREPAVGSMTFRLHARDHSKPSADSKDIDIQQFIVAGGPQRWVGGVSVGSGDTTLQCKKTRTEER
jgi:hypothetical protein